MKNTPRLIEVAFPLKEASVASVHEKNVRHGHISTLHIWPARRPLAASRAALLATLLPDPGDPEKRKALLEKIGGMVGKKTVKGTDEDGNKVEEEKEVVTGGVLAWGQENAPEMDEFRRMIREAYGGRAPKVIDPFAGGGAIPLEAMRLGCEVTAADINPVAWFILKCTLEYPQQFAGKKWPLPDFVKQWPDFIEDFIAGKVKKRRGAKRAHFSDDAQAHLDGSKINPDAEADSANTSASFQALPDADLSWHVRAWGRWVLERARQDLAARYPVIKGEPTVAYLWARTARDKLTAGPVPLLKTFWLCKKAGRRAALLPLPVAPQRSGASSAADKPQRGGHIPAQGNALGNRFPGDSRAEGPVQPCVQFVLLQESDLKNPAKLIKKHPILAQWEVTAETLTEFLNKGTMNRAGVWSPLSGRPGMIALTMDDLRRQGQQGLLGSQMTAVVVERPTMRTVFINGVARTIRTTTKAYRLPVEKELEAAVVEPEDLEEAFKDIPFGIPDEPLPPPGTLGFRIPLYGFKKWREIFTPRQLVALANFVKHTRSASKMLPSAAAEAITAYLTIVFGRFLNYMSMQCMWASAADEVKQTFSRFAFPMCWDFAEANPLTQSDRFYAGGLAVGASALAEILKAPDSHSSSIVHCESSISAGPYAVDVVTTDPPYYDAIPYSDLMDIFFVWQKRLLFDSNEEFRRFFSNRLAPKWDSASADGELIEDDSRFDGDRAAAKKAYEDGMAKAFCKSCGDLSEHGRLVVVFANKEVTAWETLVAAIIRAGFVVTASWPIQTEMPGGFRNFNRASLSSSVWIVCRKRPKTTQFGWEERVLEDMQRKLFEPRDTLGGRNILQYFFDLGIRGPDFLWAALGPALEAYSAHPYVKKTTGGLLTVPDFLREVRRLVLHFALGELPGFRDISQQTKGRGESLEIDPVTQYYLLHRAYFGLEPAPAGACIMYANACGKSDSELKLVWHVIEQGGQSKRGRPSNDELQDVNDDETTESKGNEFKLVPWEERASRDDLGETRNGQPAPLIDRLHRLMRLFQQNRTAEVQQFYDVWSLANDRAFPPLLQAVRELAVQSRQETERRLVEALATQLKLNRKRVVVEGDTSVVREEPLFEATGVKVDDTRPPGIRGGKRKKKAV